MLLVFGFTWGLKDFIVILFYGRVVPHFSFFLEAGGGGGGVVVVVVGSGGDGGSI